MEMENDEAITTLNNPDDLGIYSNVDANTARRIISQRPIKMVAGKVDVQAKQIPVETTSLEDKKDIESVSKTASENEDKILGMPKGVAIGVGVAVLAIGGFFAYKYFKGKK